MISLQLAAVRIVNVKRSSRRRMAVKHIPSFLVVVLLSGLSTALSAQIQFGSTSLILGQERDSTLRRLRQLHRIESFRTGDQWVVWSKSPPFEAIGNIGFERGRLAFISRDWTRQDEDDGGAVARAVVNSLRSLGKGTPKACSISGQDIAQPNYDHKSVEIACGNHKVSISAGKREGNNFVAVFESWREPR